MSVCTVWVNLQKGATEAVSYQVGTEEVEETRKEVRAETIKQERRERNGK
jgi:hypothetical protein